MILLVVISVGFVMWGYKMVVIDFDVGLCNFDMIMGCECCVVFDFINVIQGDVKLKQVLIKDCCFENLYVLLILQICDKDVLIKEGVKVVLDELCQEFDYIVCDSLVGIECGVYLVMYYVDEVVVVINLEVFLVCDSDRVLGLLNFKIFLLEKGDGSVVKVQFLLMWFDFNCFVVGEMMSVQDVLEILVILFLGIILESILVLKVLNEGQLVIFDEILGVGKVYVDVVGCLIGEQIEMCVNLGEQKCGFFQRLLGWMV